MGHDVDAAREALGTVPPARPAGPEAGPGKGLRQEQMSSAGGSGPHSPGSPGPETDEGPESGGYDNRTPPPRPDNRKGGYGAG